MIEKWPQAEGAQPVSPSVRWAAPSPSPPWPRPALRKVHSGGTQAWKATGKHPRPEPACAFSYEPPDFHRS